MNRWYVFLLFSIDETKAAKYFKSYSLQWTIHTITYNKKIHFLLNEVQRIKKEKL